MLELVRTNLLNMSAMDSTGLLFLAVTEEEGEEECSLLLRIQLGKRLVVLERPLYPAPQWLEDSTRQGCDTFSPSLNWSGRGAIYRGVII